MDRKRLLRLASLSALIGLPLTIWSCGESIAAGQPPRPPATVLKLLSGNDQVDTIGAILPLPYEVLVGDQHGLPVVNEPVRASAGTNHGSVDTLVFTDAQGVARLRHVLGDASGSQTVTVRLARSPGLTPLTLHATALPGRPARLAFQGDPADTFAGFPLQPLATVVALDRRGNVARTFHDTVAVRLAANTSGASLTGMALVRADSGIARFAVAIDRIGSEYRVEATAGTLSAISGIFAVIPGDGEYHAIDLGSLGGWATNPAGLNDSGVVVGSSLDGHGSPQPFTWRNGMIRALPTGNLGTGGSAQFITLSGEITGLVGNRVVLWEQGMVRPLGTSTLNGEVVIGGINSSTAVIATHVVDYYLDVPVLYLDQSETRLGKLASRAWTILNGINERGQIIGTGWAHEVAGYDTYHPFLWENGVMRDLGTLEKPACDEVPGSDCSYGVAIDVNDGGEVVGYSLDLAWRVRPYIWRNGMLQDLGAYPGEEASAVRINNRGQVAGTALHRGQWVGFLWDNGMVREIPSLGGGYVIITALAEDGTVIGSSMTAAGQRHAFVWKDGRLRDLGMGPAGGVQSRPVAINASGDVLGWSSHSADAYAGPHRGILWRIAR